MKLSGKQVESFQAALLAAFSKDELRQMVRTKLDISLEDIAQSHNQQIIVFDLITWSERCGRLADLISGAMQSNSDNLILKVWRLKYELLTHLDHPALSAEQLQALYFKSKAKNIVSETAKIDFKKPDSVVDALWDMPMQPKNGYSSLPIVEFVQRLIFLKDEQRDELQSWISEVCPLLAPTLTDEDLQASQNDIQAKSNSAPEDICAYLMVEIAPNAVYESDKYDIKFILWNANGQEFSVEPDHNGATYSFTKDEIRNKLPKLLTKILDQSYSNWGADQLILEFSLPFELFSLNVHEWEDHGAKDHFSAEHPIHVRSLERFQCQKKPGRIPNQIKTRWYECWDYFLEQNQICHFHDDHIFWLETEMIAQCHDPKIWANQFRTEKDKHCVTFTFDPCQPKTRECPIEILRRMTLFAGLLGTVWLRESCPLQAATPEIKRHIVHLLGQTYISQMGQTLKTQLNQCRGYPSHIANHLTVMWDPPVRIPKKYQSQANFV